MSARTHEPRLPRIALTLGDPAGIGPEIALAAAQDRSLEGRAHLVLVGPRKLKPAGVPLADRASLGSDAHAAEPVVWLAAGDLERWEMGRVQAECGSAAVAALRAGHDLAKAAIVDALVTGPVSKEALHLAGHRVEGQTELLGAWCGAARFEMIAIADGLRVMLLTRHMPLVRALGHVTTARVLDRLRLFDEFLKRFGFDPPKLALAGLNPHAGEHGILGTEEQDILEPALEAARAEGVQVAGPISPDTVFLRAWKGEFDGVLALYHDQAFIPVKLVSQDRGLTVIAGLPYLRVSPVHGTAFDIAGRGVASPANLIAALRQACDWTSRRLARTRVS